MPAARAMPTFKERALQFVRRQQRSVQRRYARLRHGNDWFVSHYLGADFLCRLDEPMGRELGAQAFERAQIGCFMQLCAEVRPELMIDVGANCGPYTCILLRTGLVREAIAFEPNPRNAMLLRANLMINHLLGAADVREQALGRAPARLWLADGPPDNYTNSRIADSVSARDGEGGRYVEVVRLDDICTLAGETLAIKIDVEGHEVAALEGMARTLSDNRGIVQVESYDRRDAVVRLMAEHGYRLVKAFHAESVFRKD